MRQSGNGFIVEDFHWNGRGRFGSYFFFLLPVLTINLYPELNGKYAYLSVGWLTFSVRLTFWWSRKRKPKPLIR